MACVQLAAESYQGGGMSQLIQGHAVLRVDPKKSRDGSKDMWDVGLSDGNEWRTFDGQLAALAASIVGQQGHSFETSISQGKYKNLDGIILAGNALPQQPVAPGTQLPAGVPVVNGGAPTQTVGQADFETAKDRDIRRQVAFKQASLVVANLLQGAGPEALEQAVELIASTTDRFENGLKAGQAVQGQAQQAPMLQHDGTPQGVAEAVNQAAGEPVVAQGAAGPKW